MAPKRYRNALSKLDYDDSDRRYQTGSDGTEEQYAHVENGSARLALVSVGR
jgi:hypothetical protein